MQVSFLCRGDRPIPGLIGPDQGWHFLRRIEFSGGHCAVYEVNDNWHPRESYFEQHGEKTFFTKLKNGEKAGINWDKAPIGKYTDAEVAHLLGVTRATVTNARRQRRVDSLRKKQNIDWDQQPLGKVSDSEIAKKLGISPGAVWKARKKRGISLDSDG